MKNRMPRPDKRTTDDRRIQRVDVREVDPARQQVGQHATGGDRSEGLQGEFPAHAPQRHPVERQVDQHEHQAEVPAHRVVQQEGHARHAADHQPALGEDGQAQRGHHRGQHHALHVLGDRVAQRFFVGGGAGAVGRRGQRTGGDQVAVSVVARRGAMGRKGHAGGEQRVGSGIRHDLHDSCR
jgi:hypothetical protein